MSAPGAQPAPLRLAHDDPRALALVRAIQGGDVEALTDALRAEPALATARLVDARGVARTLLHVAADWPGHFPRGAATVAALAAAGAELDARVRGTGAAPGDEAPLHWAASSDDVAVLDALLDAGADLEVSGAVFTGGAPLSDAVVFAMWRAARRLVERGAATTPWQAAALGLVERVRAAFGGTDPRPDAPRGPTSLRDARALTNAFWHACRGGQRATAELLLDLGAERDWLGYDHRTPLDAAHDSGDAALVDWLRARGARRAAELARG